MLLGFLNGVLIGFLLAVPVGPIGILCIRHTLAEGRRSAVSTMLGAASADMIYGGVAIFGVNLVSTFIMDHFQEIRLVGGLVLIILGVKTFRSHITNGTRKLTLNRHAGNFVSTFLLTLTNPLTLFAFAAAFAGFGTVEESAPSGSEFLVVGGVFLGSLLWFTSLVAATHTFRDVLTRKGLDIINKVAGSLIIAAGTYAFISIFL